MAKDITDSDRIERATRAVGKAYSRAKSSDPRPLWTPEMADVLPDWNSLHSGKAVNPTAYYQYFSPVGSAEWYVFAASKRGDDTIFYVYADLGPGGHPEPGYVTLSELRGLRLPFMQVIELNRYYAPEPYKAIVARVRR